MTSGCHDCRTTRGDTHTDRTGQVVCLRCYLHRHQADPTVPAAQRTTTRTANRRPIALDTLLATLTALELSPTTVDAKTPLVRCLCPACGSPDPDGIWRSLLIDGRHGLAWVCDNDCRPDRINTAFRHLVDERTSDVA